MSEQTEPHTHRTPADPRKHAHARTYYPPSEIILPMLRTLFFPPLPIALEGTPLPPPSCSKGTLVPWPWPCTCVCGWECGTREGYPDVPAPRIPLAPAAPGDEGEGEADDAPVWTTCRSGAR